MTRRLHTFGAPDLEVIIGKSEKLYRYHSFLLANQSEYVDTILSSPVALKNQEAGRINFPDIDIETWEKMIKFLSPGVPHPTLEEMIIVIPFYDKYQFTVGLKYCDDLLSARMAELYNNWRTCREFCCLISMIWPLNGFPLSKPIAVNWASRMLRKFHTIDEGVFPVLMPLVENDEAIVKSMVSTYLGRMCKGMSMNEMRDLIKQQDFPEKCITRCKQIKALDDQIQRLSVEKVYIHGGCGDGTYVYCSSSEFIKEYNSEFATCHNGGAMKGYWIEETKYPDEILVLGSMDVFGNLGKCFHGHGVLRMMNIIIR